MPIAIASKTVEHKDIFLQGQFIVVVRNRCLQIKQTSCDDVFIVSPRVFIPALPQFEV